MQIVWQCNWFVLDILRTLSMISTYDVESRDFVTVFKRKHYFFKKQSSDFIVLEVVEFCPEISVLVYYNKQ